MQDSYKEAMTRETPSLLDNGGAVRPRAGPIYEAFQTPHSGIA